MSDNELFGKSSKEKAIEIASALRARMREVTVRDVYGEEQVLFGPKLPPPHRKAYIREFAKLAEAKDWYDACRTTVRVLFAQLIRQDHTHPLPYMVRWGAGDLDLPVLWRPLPERVDRAEIRFGKCGACGDSVFRHHRPCTISRAFNTAHLTHIRTWGDEWGFKHGTLLPWCAFEKFQDAHEYCKENANVYGWLRLQRFSDDQQSYYVVERRNVTHRKPQERVRRRPIQRCEVCNLPVIECPGSHSPVDGASK